MRTLRSLVAVGVALVATDAAADTVEATSTTYISSGSQRSGAGPGTQPDLQTVTPVIEVLSVAARGIRNPVFDDLDVVVSTWGSYDLADRRWDNGTDGNLTGDVVAGYVQGRLFSRRLTLRVGRENVAVGVGRVASIDGADLALRLPLGIGLTAYAGVPVSQRFSARDVDRSWNALGGDFAWGGRASLGMAFAGAVARGFEVGASAAFVDQGSQVVRRDAGVDARLQLAGDLALNGNAVFSVTEEEAGRLAEANVLATWHPARRWFVTADWRRTAPDLLLSRTSILAVFADSTRDEAGAGFRYELTRSLQVGADYHALIEPKGDAGTRVGADAALRGDYADGPVRAGAEVTYLDGADNGYIGARFYARREIGALFGAGDVIAYVYREAINGQDYSASVGATAGVRIGNAWTASVTGRAGVTPYMEQQFDVMAKLAYNQTYRVREVR